MCHQLLEGRLCLLVLQKNCCILCRHWPPHFPPERILARYCHHLPVVKCLSNIGQPTSRWCSVHSSIEWMSLVKFPADLVNVEVSPVCIFSNWISFLLFVDRIATVSRLPCRFLERLYKVTFLKRGIETVGGVDTRSWTPRESIIGRQFKFAFIDGHCFYQNNGIQSQRTHNSFQYSVRLWSWLMGHLAPRSLPYWSECERRRRCTFSWCDSNWHLRMLVLLLSKGRSNFALRWYV